MIIEKILNYQISVTLKDNFQFILNDNINEPIQEIYENSVKNFTASFSEKEDGIE